MHIYLLVLDLLLQQPDGVLLVLERVKLLLRAEGKGRKGGVKLGCESELGLARSSPSAGFARKLFAPPEAPT